MSSQILIVFNPSARRGKSLGIYEQYVSFLKVNQMSFDVYATTGENDVLRLSKQIELLKPRILSIVGGDGTLNLAVEAISTKDIYLHLIPAGSGNDFAKMIYANIDYLSIFKLIKSDLLSYQEIDTWQCNNRKFINIFGVGFDGSLVHRMQHTKPWIPATLKYWVAIFSQIFTYRSARYNIGNTKKKSFMTAFANGQVYGGNFKIAPKANCQDELLDIICIQKIWIPLRLFYLPLLQTGNHLNLNITESSRSNKITISSNEMMLGQLDGEPISAQEFSISFCRKVKLLC